jgi:hypothetical protein
MERTPTGWRRSATTNIASKPIEKLRRYFNNVSVCSFIRGGTLGVRLRYEPTKLDEALKSLSQRTMRKLFGFSKGSDWIVYRILRANRYAGLADHPS